MLFPKRQQTLKFLATLKTFLGQITFLRANFLNAKQCLWILHPHNPETLLWEIGIDHTTEFTKVPAKSTLKLSTYATYIWRNKLQSTRWHKHKLLWRNFPVLLSRKKFSVGCRASAKSDTYRNNIFSHENVGNHTVISPHNSFPYIENPKIGLLIKQIVYD